MELGVAGFRRRVRPVEQFGVEGFWFRLQGVYGFRVDAPG